ncbi:MAG: hypothetical protein ACREAE_03555, partial [Nitrosopumilaceae archaeon]
MSLMETLEKLDYLHYIPTDAYETDKKEIKINSDEQPSKIFEKSFLEFIIHMPAHIHITFLYKNPISNNKVLSAFFNPNIIWRTKNGLVSKIPKKLKSVKNIVYDDFLYMDKTAAMKKFADWVSKLHSSNKSDMPTRIAGEDATWWARNGFAKEHLKLEQSIGRNSYENMSILCCYDVSHIDNEQLKSIVDSHGYV